MVHSTKKFLSFFSLRKIIFDINKMQEAIWPIKRHELPKFISVTLLMFCILGIQNLVRALKDSIVNTMIGTETISFLKFWGVMPAAFFFTMFYVKLVNTIRGETIFYLVIIFFLSFFAVFAFLIFPNHEVLHLSSERAQELLLAYPNFKWFILLMSNWSFSLFYIIAELWPNIVFALLFWQFVNMISSVEQSKRFYPIFGLFGQTGLLLSGIFLQKLSIINDYLKYKLDSHVPYNVFSIQIVLTVVLSLGLVAISIFWFINHKILTQNQSHAIIFKPTKQKQTNLIDSIKLVLSSKYIMLIATLLICYGITINLVEGPWKATVTKVYKTPTEFAAFVGGYLSYTGLFTILFVILGSNIVRKLGWFSAAIITPVMVFGTGIMFFTTEIFPGFVPMIIASFVLTDPILIAIAIGAIQNVLSKSSKYTLFDSTKEMLYVPLENELKTKGKAAADIIGIKLGKSTSALLQSLIFVIVPTATYQSISVYLMIVFAVVCMIWIWAVKELAKEYQKISNNNETNDLTV